MKGSGNHGHTWLGGVSDSKFQGSSSRLLSSGGLDPDPWRLCGGREKMRAARDSGGEGSDFEKNMS